MLAIRNLTVKTKENKEILHNINLDIKEGSVHYISGPNGAGKSSLLQSIMGNPNLIAEGTIFFQKGKQDLELSTLETNERSLLGIFLANQTPTEIPGVPVRTFLRLIYNSHRPKSEQLPVFKFNKKLNEVAENIDFPARLLKRNLNEDFSGGEKKKMEILQMMLLEPKLIMLDEIDSGLDKNSQLKIFEQLEKYKFSHPKSSFLIITHYDKLYEFLKPDFIHQIKDGTIIN